VDICTTQYILLLYNPIRRKSSAEGLPPESKCVAHAAIARTTTQLLPYLGSSHNKDKSAYSLNSKYIYIITSNKISKSTKYRNNYAAKKGPIKCKNLTKAIIL